MKTLVSRCALVLVIAVVSLAFLATFSYADDNPLTLACPNGSAQVGVPYSSALVATGGSNYTFIVTSAYYTVPLPLGLTLNSSTGALTGTPTTAGTYYPVEFEVYDAQYQRFAYCSITVTVPVPLSVTCQAVSTGDVGVPFNSGPMNVTGGTAPNMYSIVGTLPLGLTLNTSTGAVTGTPTAAGTFTVKVTDAAGNSSTSCMITINGPLAVTCAAVNTGDVGAPFDSGPMAVTGGTAPYTYSIVGTLPPGLTLNPSTGEVTGPPTASGTFTVRVTDAVGNSSTSCMITINGPLSVTCSVINTGDVGVPFNSGPMTVSGGTPPYAYSIVGTLPPGLMLNPSTGAVMGTPTAPGTFTVRVTDAVGNSSTSCTITINAPLSLTCAAVNIGDVGVPFNSGPMNVTGGTPPYAYSIVGTLPAGLTLDSSTGAVTGTPTAAGTFTVEVTDAAGGSSTGCMITINGPLSVNCSAINTGDVGVPFDSGPMNMTGGTPPYAYSIVGTLPAGLTLNPSTGEVTGTPTASGTFTVEVTDAVGNSSTSCMITINGSLSVTCAAMNTGTVDEPFDSGPMTVTGGTAPYTFSIGSGTLPAGLTLNPSTGEVTGTPTAPGTFTVQVTDAAGGVGTACSISIFPPLSVTCAAVNTGTVGVHFDSGPMTVTGGALPYNFSIGSGTLPAGLTLNTSNGEVTGTPTASGTFTVQVTDALGDVGTACAISINPPVSASCVSINAVQGVAITPVTLTGSGGAGGPYTFTAMGLPSGLSISSNGTISGTPTQSGTFPYTVTVTDSAGNKSTVNCSVTVAPAVSAGCVSINAVQGVAITPVTLTGSGGAGGPYTFTAMGLPSGLSISSNGTISGTPTQSGTFPYTVTVTDSAGNKSTVNCSVTVAPAVSAGCVSINAVQGVAITPVTLTGSGGAGGPYTFTAMGLPSGLSISSNGTISGTPTQSGTFPYTVTVTDSAGNKSTVNCSVTVAPAVSASCVSINAVKGVAITPVTMTGSGGAGGPYIFTATGLPAGLTMASNGTISGTPTQSGTFPYTVTVTDKAGNKGTVNCSVTVVTAPTASCVVIDAVKGVAIIPVTMVGSGGAGGPYTFTATGLPAGLTMASNGTISGTPTVMGTFKYTVTVTDSAGNKGTVNCSVTVYCTPPTASCVVINAVQNVAITPATMVGSGGAGGPYTFTATGLPTGLSISSSGTISGTPTVTGTFPYTVTVTDSVGDYGTVNCSVTVQSAPLSSGDTATIGFWHNNNGQALIDGVNGGPTATNLASWLATNFPYLYGVNSGNNLTGKTNADVAALFLTFFNVKGTKTMAQVMGGALASYVTSSTLAGSNIAAGYGFNVSASGTGAKTYNVGSNGTAIGLANNTSYTVLQLLQQANLETKLGTFNANTFNNIFDDINSKGDIN